MATEISYKSCSLKRKYMAINKWRFVDMSKIDYLVAVRLSFPTDFWHMRSRVPYLI